MRVCKSRLLTHPLRAATWLLAALCLWMGTGGVLHHTDDLAYISSLAARTALGHATPAAPADRCAACEWTQGLQTGTPAAFQILLPLDALVPGVRAFTPSLFSRSTLHRNPRGPPVFLF